MSEEQGFGRWNKFCCIVISCFLILLPLVIIDFQSFFMGALFAFVFPLYLNKLFVFVRWAAEKLAENARLEWESNQ